MERIDCFPVPIFHDNLAWCFPTGPSSVAVVDPGDGLPVARALTARDLTVSHVLITHHHRDHSGGVEVLGRRWNPVLVGPANEDTPIPGMDLTLAGDCTFQAGGQLCQVMQVPGHTRGHVAYLVGNLLFAGDTLFSIGCGRVFEGSPEQMWASLCKLRSLPDSTELLCGHEYTLQNIAFALSLDPGNEALLAFRQECEARLRQAPTVLPSPLGREKLLNPFLRCDEPLVARLLGLEGAAPEKVFRMMRQEKDRF